MARRVIARDGWSRGHQPVEQPDGGDHGRPLLLGQPLLQRVGQPLGSGGPVAAVPLPAGLGQGDQLATAVARIGRPVGAGRAARAPARVAAIDCGRTPSRVASADAVLASPLPSRAITLAWDGDSSSPVATSRSRRRSRPSTTRISFAATLDESVGETVTIVSLACSVWTDESHRFRKPPSSLPRHRGDAAVGLVGRGDVGQEAETTSQEPMTSVSGPGQ